MMLIKFSSSGGWGRAIVKLNPYGAPTSLPTLTSSKIVPKKGFQGLSFQVFLMHAVSSWRVQSFSRQESYSISKKRVPFYGNICPHLLNISLSLSSFRTKNVVTGVVPSPSSARAFIYRAEGASESPTLVNSHRIFVTSRCHTFR